MSITKTFNGMPRSSDCSQIKIVRTASFDKVVELINEKLIEQNLKIFPLNKNNYFGTCVVKKLDGKDAHFVQWHHLKKNYIKDLEIPGWTISFPWKTSLHENVKIHLRHKSVHYESPIQAQCLS